MNDLTEYALMILIAVAGMVLGYAGVMMLTKAILLL